jgi:hypothetical protein
MSQKLTVSRERVNGSTRQRHSVNRATALGAQKPAAGESPGPIEFTLTAES